MSAVYQSVALHTSSRFFPLFFLSQTSLSHLPIYLLLSFLAYHISLFTIISQNTRPVSSRPSYVLILLPYLTSVSSVFFLLLSIFLFPHLCAYKQTSQPLMLSLSPCNHVSLLFRPLSLLPLPLFPIFFLSPSSLLCPCFNFLPSLKSVYPRLISPCHRVLPFHPISLSSLFFPAGDFFPIPLFFFLTLFFPVLSTLL